VTWEEELFALLDDLEGRAEALYDAEREAELADRTRAEYQQVTFASRLMASIDDDIALDVLGVGVVAGRLARAASDWCLVGGAGQDWIIRLDAIAAIHGASSRAVPEVAWSPLTRIGLGGALRRIADSGDRCVVHLVDGRGHDGLVHRVGADFVELTVGEGRLVLITFETLAAVQRRD
jgi:hypothetical protein